MWSKFSRWLYDVPIRDPVERRSAWFVQILFLFLGTAFPLNKLYIMFFNTGYQRLLHSPGFHLPVVIDQLSDLAMVISAWVGWWLLRHGHFRRAIIQLVTVVLLSALLAYATFGYWVVYGDLIPIMTIALGGLMLGRRALWIIYLTVMFEFVVAMTSDLLRAGPSLQSTVHGGTLPSAFVDLPSRAFGFLLIVLILDYSSKALRESLAESSKNWQRLQDEMLKREEAQEQLLHTHKMDAVGKLASGIAHDFNNILAIILGFARERHRVDEPDIPPTEQVNILTHAMDGIDTAARRGAAINRKLLNFTRRDVAHAETFDLGNTLRELRPMLQQLLPAPYELDMKLSVATLPIHFDRSHVELAMLNFASNARDAMPAGGRFSIHTAVSEGNALLQLSDTGTGMSAEVRERIFEPFFTTKPPGSGTGLGLAVVYPLIEKAGGTITVQSTPGQGTRFDIRLPLALQDAIAAPVQATDARPSPPIHALLIDDDDDLRKLLADALRRGGCTVDTAASGAEALQAAARLPTPQVLVCDNCMPDGGGAQLLARLRVTLPEVPAILISAYLDSHELPMDDPLTEYMPKPFAPGDLLIRVQQAAIRQATPS
ncbi:MAG: ATP-binding protein [Rhodanobacter sp.]